MATTLEQMMAKREARGFARGLERGLARAEARDRAAVLIRLLRRRFGKVPDDVEARVRAASVAEVYAWFDACFDAPDIDAVFCGARRDES